MKITGRELGSRETPLIIPHLCYKCNGQLQQNPRNYCFIHKLNKYICLECYKKRFKDDKN